MKNRNLEVDWEDKGNEKVITDILIHVSNGENADSFNMSNLPPELTKVLKYCAQMVSPL